MNYKFKANDSETMQLDYVWVMFWENFQLIYEKDGVYGYFYDFSDDSGSTGFDDILVIHKYLMVENNIK